MQLPRLLPRAGGAGKAGKQLFDLFESCLSDLPTGEAGGGALRRRTAAAAAAELRLLAERLLLQQAEEGAGLADAAQQGFTLGRLAQLLQAALASPPPPASVQGSGADGIGDGAGGEGWDGALLRQVLWCSAALQALTVGRSSVTKAAARQLERLLQERWAVPAVPGEDGPHGGDEASGGGSGGGGGGGAAVDAAAAAEARLQVARAAVQLLESLQAPADAACAAPAEAAAARARWLQHLCGPLLARLCACVCPERREPMYMLQLIKAPSQTDFIPGSIGGGGLVAASDVGGPLMRHVKNFVCRRLDMEGLLEDDFGMELLVAGSLIDLSLPIAAVYQRFWQQQGSGARGGRRGGGGSAGAGSVMAITFRLSGLDGEATEPVVKQLPAADADAGSPEEQHAAAAALCDRAGAGLRLLLALLAGPAPVARRARPQLLKLLAACCALRGCRRGLLGAGALRALLHLVRAAAEPLLEAEAGDAGPSAPAALAPAAPVRLGGEWSELQLLELLRLLEALANEASAADAPLGHAADARAPAAPAASAAAVAAEGDVAVDVCQLARGLTLLERHGLGDCGAVLARVLTALARSDGAAQRGLLDHFAAALDLSALDAAADAAAAAAQRLQLQGLLRLTEALTQGADEAARGSGGGGGEAGGAAGAAGAEGDACGFRQLVLERGVPGRLAAYLVGCFEAPPAGAARAPGAYERRGRRIDEDGGGGGGGGGAEDGDEEDEEEGEAEGHDWIPFASSPAASSPITPRPLRRRQRQQQHAAASPACAPAAASATAAAPPRHVEPGGAAWQAAAARPGVAFALQLLTALSRGHGGVCAALAAAPGLLALAHALEGVHGGRELAPLAEGLLEAVAAAGGACGAAGAVAEMRAATRAAMRAAAARKREAMLASMGMIQ
ncbi:E3 ubiquitin-protein ligase UBR4, partial [Monoraphidium neglectum]